MSGNRVTVFARAGVVRVPERAVLDLAHLQARVRQDRATVAQLTQLFVEDSVHFVAECAQAIAGGTLAAGIRPAYTLRISARNLSAHELANLADTLEQALRANDLPRASAALQDVSGELARLHAYLLSIVAEADPEGGERA